MNYYVVVAREEYKEEEVLFYQGNYSSKELAKDNNLNPDYYEPFIEFYIEECRESDRGYFFSDDKYIIDTWWDHNKDLYDTKTPYMEIKK